MKVLCANTKHRNLESQVAISQPQKVGIRPGKLQRDHGCVAVFGTYVSTEEVESSGSQGATSKTAGGPSREVASVLAEASIIVSMMSMTMVLKCNG